MTTQGEDILAYLDSAITTREAAALAATDEAEGNWSDGGEFGETVHAVKSGGSIAVDPYGYMSDGTRSHIALNDPASVLRRCAADRKLIELHGGHMHSCPATDDTGYLDEWTQFSHDEACPVVRVLAEGYGWTEGER